MDIDEDIDSIINNVLDDVQMPPPGRTATSDVQELTQTWINERTSPALLPCKQDLLDRIMLRVSEQIEFIEVNSLEMNPNSDIKFQLLIVETELERIKYLIRSYLRIRLLKVDKYMEYYKSSPLEIQNLSQTECKYLDKHYDLLKTLYTQQFMSSFPPHLKLLNDITGGISMVDTPDLDRAVFFKVVRTVGRKILLGEDTVRLREGNIYVLRFSAVQKYVESGDVVLI